MTRSVVGRDSIGRLMDFTISGDSGQIDGSVADDASGAALTVRSGVGAPSGAPSATELPIGIDTGTGFIYLWNGSAWVELVTT